jgi:hypothetical protein
VPPQGTWMFLGNVQGLPKCYIQTSKSSKWDTLEKMVQVFNILLMFHVSIGLCMLRNTIQLVHPCYKNNVL